MTTEKDAHPPTFGVLEKKRYSEQVSQLIYEKILSMELKRGERLPTERELAHDFQVSRTVIREAIRELELSGLVTVKKGAKGGIFIDTSYHRPLMNSLEKLASTGRVTVSHILEARMLIEPHITIEATLKSKKEDLDALEKLLEESSRHLDDVNLLKKNNFKFHILIGQASENPIFSIFMSSVMEILQKLSGSFLDLAAEKSFLASHQAIFRAMKEKDVEKVKKLIEKDIMIVDKKFGGFLKKQGGKGSSK